MNYLRIAAAYEILAGLIGLSQIFRFRELSNGRAVTFNIYALGLACVSILLGVLLWAGSSRARRVSLVFQAIQIPRLSSSALILGVLVGVEGTVRFEGPLVSLFTNTGVTLYALRPFAAQPIVVGINLVAALAMGLLWRRAAKAVIEDHEPAG
jgi:hypothetical protein